MKGRKRVPKATGFSHTCRVDDEVYAALSALREKWGERSMSAVVRRVIAEAKRAP